MKRFLEEGSAMRALVRIPTTLVLLVLGWGVATAGITAAAQDLWPWPAPPPKPAPDGQAAPLVSVTQGDTVGDPFVIPAIPFTTTGNTCAFNHNYDAVCQTHGSQGRDVVYRYECSVNIDVTVDLCASTYDTKVYVFEDVANNVIACNDDYCSSQSHLYNVPFVAGHIYYIVIDGYSAAACGDYVLAVEEHESCVAECPLGAIPEGEPVCHDHYSDSYNGGCGCQPDPCFTLLQASSDPIVICGTTGVFSFHTSLYRDGDWFQIDVTQAADICLAGDAEIPMWYFIIDGRDGCMGEIVAYDEVGPCSPIADLCYYCDPGTWWLWAGPRAWDLDFLCGSIYWMEITGYIPDPSGVPEEGPDQGTTWGKVKGLFR